MSEDNFLKSLEFQKIIAEFNAARLKLSEIATSDEEKNNVTACEMTKNLLSMEKMIT